MRFSCGPNTMLATRESDCAGVYATPEASAGRQLLALVGRHRLGKDAILFMPEQALYLRSLRPTGFLITPAAMERRLRPVTTGELNR